MKSLLFLWIIFILANIAAESSEDSGTRICDDLYHQTNDVWLIGEAPEATSFASKYLAILAYIPTAIVLQSYVVVSDLAVYEAVRENNVIISWRRSSSPFSSFFDFEHFTSYWAKHRIKVVSSSTYRNCFTTAVTPSSLQTSRYAHNVAELFRVPEFLPYTRKTFNIMLDYANFTTGRKLPQFPFPPHHQIRIKSRYKMSGMYSFWNDTSPLLSYVLTALKPAPAIQAAVDSLISFLPRNYLAVHIRLDDEAFDLINPPYLRITGNKSSETREDHVISLIVASIIGSSCVSQHGAKTIYLATNFRPSAPATKKRTVRLVEALREASFTVVTRRSLANFVLKGKEGKSRMEDLHSLEAMRDMSPDHWNFIDMIMSEQSGCFIPSLAPSLMSYMITRYRKLNRNIFEKYDDINRESYGAMYFYRDWGF